MAWVKLDDSFPLNIKTRALTVEARYLYVTSLCWSAMQMNDGIFPASDIHAVAALAGVAAETAQQLLPKLWHEQGFDCEACAEVGQPNPVPPGHVAIHCYLERNDSRAQAEERKRKDRERKRDDSGKDSGKESRRKPPRESRRNPDASSRPVPTADLDSRRLGNSRANGQRPDDDEISTVPEAVWTEYAKLKLDKQRPGSVENPDPWKRTTAANARTEHGERAERLWREFDITPAQCALSLLTDKAPAAHYRRKAPA